MKLYTVKSSAHRAAKQAGFEKDQYEIVEVDGKFGFQPIEMTEDTSEGEALEAMERELDEAQNPDAPEYQADAPAPAGAGQPDEEVAPAKGKAKLDVKRKSDIPRPTKTVWHIADEMFAANPQVRRKDVIAECVRRGIAFYTARTQYQQWLATKNGTAK